MGLGPSRPLTMEGSPPRAPPNHEAAPSHCPVLCRRGRLPSPKCRARPGRWSGKCPARRSCWWPANTGAPRRAAPQHPQARKATTPVPKVSVPPCYVLGACKTPPMVPGVHPCSRKGAMGAWHPGREVGGCWGRPCRSALTPPPPFAIFPADAGDDAGKPRRIQQSKNWTFPNAKACGTADPFLCPPGGLEGLHRPALVRGGRGATEEVGCGTTSPALGCN